MARMVHTALLAALATQLLPAQEWSRFRGPAGQGVGEANLPTTFTNVHVRWRVDVGGTGQSSPVLWGDRLFLTRVVEPAKQREVVCYDAETGKQLWAYASAVIEHKQHKLNSFASSTPVVDELGVYVLWSSGDKLQALALEPTGKLRWQRDLGTYFAEHGSANSPILHGELLVIANENEGDDCFVQALDRKTGESVWRQPLPQKPRWACYSPPFCYETMSGKPLLVLASAAQGVTGFEPQTGKVLWRANPGFKSRFIAAPVLSGNKLLVITGSGDSGKECTVFELDEDHVQEPRVSYQLRRGLPYVPSGIALAGRFFLFADSGFASCFEAKDGRELWRKRIDGKFFSSPVSNGKAIYLGDREGRLWTFSTSKFEVLGHFDLGSPICATPALARGAMFVRTADQLLRLQNQASK